MAEKKAPAQKLREMAQQVQRRHEAHALRKQLEKCREELSMEMEKYGQACFSGDRKSDSIRQSVSALQTHARSLEKQIDRLDGIFRCPDCGLKTGEEDAFCRGCGKALHKNPAPASIVWPEEQEISGKESN